MSHRDQQTTNHVLMIAPVAFGSNPDTLATNAFQSRDEVTASRDIQVNARNEFESVVRELRAADIKVSVVEDTREPWTPDSIFPNNWISFHHTYDNTMDTEEGVVVLYPMMAPNRRAERKLFESVTAVLTESGRAITQRVDLTGWEGHKKFLEGTGSLVLDRVRRIAYACRSGRTNPEVLLDFTRRMGCASIIFEAVDEKGQPIYHTNVVMSLGSSFAVVCAEAFISADERETVLDSLYSSGREVILISLKQMAQFGANLLELRSTKDHPFIALSHAAYQTFTYEQEDRLAKHGRLLPLRIPTIEKYGGGSVRCMLAEVFLPTQN
ncbi:TPA: amidinotransferase [Patescibacteria group bacterium]|nr:MAG: hypothetical protein VE99_C0001G0102 [candidate division Kazan bacterium GW2011_GWC1_52_13]KKW26771.1 MAG: hypothetical protein VF00_C0002G0096 [candidate division Kazan bacterium GW2011_GWB1_52_7]HAV65767.1 amidinotransferase [Patescibacteria group bacterium]HCR42823.1 amidinotransferase [Patescibacteria group bacterium]